MLYDQAFLARLYLELAQATGGRFYESVCRETLDFCLAKMRTQEGGFVAALDATVGGEEGGTYLWTKEEISNVEGLSQSARDAFLKWSGFDRARPDEKLTIAERAPLGSVDSRPGTSEHDPVDAILGFGTARRKLLEARDKRPQPARVEHVITGWNAWLVSALARAGMVLNEPRYLQAAIETMALLDAKLRRPDGLYARRFIEGETRFPGELGDQAAVAEALLDLHEATLDGAWLARAAELVAKIDAKFGRPDGSFDDSVEPDLIFRTREVSDGAVPSGISQMNVALARLARISGNPAHLARARRAIEAVLPDVQATPADHPYGTIAWDLAFNRVARIAFAGPRPVLMLFRAPVLFSYRPDVVMTIAEDASDGSDRARAVVWDGEKRSRPAFDAAELLRLLDR
jgi:uncharacterized protein YyaL (SSP411 family)